MSNLKQQVISGVIYTAVAKYSGIIISLVVMAVLARLLTAPFISAYYHDERLLSISLWLSIRLFFSSAGIVPNSLFFKDKEFKK